VAAGVQAVTVDMRYSSVRQQPLRVLVGHSVQLKIKLSMIIDLGNDLVFLESQPLWFSMGDSSNLSRL